MHYAAANGQSLALYMLLKYVPDSANAKCSDGRTPLEMAKYGMCRKLLQNHARDVAARKAKEVALNPGPPLKRVCGQDPRPRSIESLQLDGGGQKLGFRPYNSSPTH